MVLTAEIAEVAENCRKGTLTTKNPSRPLCSALGRKKRVLDPFLPPDVEHRRPRRFLTPSLSRRATQRLAGNLSAVGKLSQETKVLTICNTKGAKRRRAAKKGRGALVG